LTAKVDRGQINRVFTNLILNSIEAMPDGGDLRVIVRGDGANIFVMFEDTGVGIPSETIDKIFTPYYTTKHGGTGLGLSIVKRILQDHGATIEAESTPGSGTRFVIIFKQIIAAPGGGTDKDE